jgi:NADH:ubiquinone oxidoreductase subunit E
LDALSKTSAVPFSGTKEQEDALQKVIGAHKNAEGALIPVMHQAQEIYGYLPAEVQTMIAEGLDAPLAEVYGVATFYARFSLNPKGRYQIGVCLGTACYVKGSGEILEKIKERLHIGVDECSADGKFSLDATRCIGACGLAPVMTVNEDVYGRLTLDDIDGILEKYMGE